MPGQMYNRNLRDTKAYSEGFTDGYNLTGGDNPHPTGSTAYAAWAAGEAAGELSSCTAYAGMAECPIPVD